MSRWFGAPDRGRAVHVDWARRVRADREQVQQVLFALLAINVGVFVLWTQARNAGLTSFMAAHFLVSAESVLSLRLWTLITSCFSHMDVWHLAFNMLAMWIFGRDVGLALGSRALVHLYLVGGIVSSLAQAAFGLVTGDMTPALGASGSVMALAVLFGALFPNRTLLLNFFIPVPAALAVGGYIVLDVLGVFGSGFGGNIAHAAHLGGAAYGLVYWWLWVRRRR